MVPTGIRNPLTSQCLPCDKGTTSSGWSPCRRQPRFDHWAAAHRASYPDCYRMYPFRFASHHLLARPGVSLRGHDTRVSEHFLEGGEVSAALQPLAGECVAVMPISA
jgi:hypothetical protein